MKCTYHPEMEATETCVNCSMPVCSACVIPIENKNYCQSCIDEAFVSRKAKPGAILGLISGIIAALSGMLLTIQALTPGGGEDEWRFGKQIQMGAGANWTQAGYGIALMGLGLLAIIGSRYALVREHYKLAVAGGICAALCMPLLGIPALILIILSHEEFNQPYVDWCQKESPHLLNRLHW
jgi:hypothetical protein